MLPLEKPNCRATAILRFSHLAMPGATSVRGSPPNLAEELTNDLERQK
jgi:hypothetical protein